MYKLFCFMLFLLYSIASDAAQVRLAWDPPDNYNQLIITTNSSTNIVESNRTTNYIPEVVNLITNIFLGYETNMIQVECGDPKMTNCYEEQIVPLYETRNVTNSSGDLLYVTNMVPSIYSTFTTNVTYTTNIDDGLVITGYKLFYGLTNNSYISVIDVGNVTNYLVTNLISGSTYYFAGKSYNKYSNESDYSKQLVWTMVLSTNDFILDNNYISTNFVIGATEKYGDWIEDEQYSFYYTNCIHDGNTNKGTKSVIFRPTLTSSGIYFVSFWSCGFTNRSTNVPIDIVHASGTKTVYFNERSTGSCWNIIGTNVFNSGSSGYVLLRTDNTQDGYVMADAVRFSLVPSNTAPVINLATSVNTIAYQITNLIAVVSDDGLPLGSIVTQNWAQVSGPGSIIFGNTNIAATTIKSVTSGIYTSRLFATDGELSSNKYVTINVAPYSAILYTSPQSITQYCTIGENASTQSFQVRNSGSGSLSYLITDNSGLISESPTSGSSTGEYDNISLSYSTAGSWLGIYTSLVYVAITNGPSNTNTIPIVINITNSSNVIIVDNADFANISTVGVWSVTTQSSGNWRTNYWHDGNTNKGTKSVIFRPSLIAGSYEVSTFYYAATNRDTKVPIDIISKNGTNTVYVNQRINGSRWYIIGTNSFNTGTNGYVKIRTDDTTNGYVIADAVKFKCISYETNQVVKPSKTKNIRIMENISTNGNTRNYSINYAAFITQSYLQSNTLDSIRDKIPSNSIITIENEVTNVNITTYKR